MAVVEAPWLLVPFSPAYESWVIYAWLESFSRSRFGRAYGGSNAWRDGHRPIIMRLLREAITTMAVDPKAPEVAIGFACTEPETVHYALVKHRWHKAGLAPLIFDALLGDRLGQMQHVTHELVDMQRAMAVPSCWTNDPFYLARKYVGHG